MGVLPAFLLGYFIASIIALVFFIVLLSEYDSK